MTVTGQQTVDAEPVVVELAGEIDAGDTDFAEELLERVEGATRVIVDLVDVSFIDSSVIRALVLVRRRVAEAGGWLRVVYRHHVIRRVIEMCALTEVLPQYSSVDGARRGVSSSPPSSESTGDGRDGRVSP